MSYSITYRVYYWITTEVYDNVFFLSAINQQANLLNGCRYYTPSSEINPPTYGNGEDGEVYDYIFYDTEDLTCIHQLRTDNSANPDTVFIETVEDDSSAMDGFQASIIQMNGDRWEREYGTENQGTEAEVYVKFYPAEIDTTVFWFEEVYDIAADEESITCSLPSRQWRLISFNIEPGDPDIDLIFDGVAADSIMDFEGQLWHTGQNPQLTNWNVLQGFNVHIPEDEAATSVTVEGSELFPLDTLMTFTPDSAGMDTVYGIPVRYYRYYMAYHPEISVPVDEVFASMIDDSIVTWIRNAEGEFYFPDYPSVSTTFLCHPGEGYDFNFEDDDEVSFCYSTSFSFDPDIYQGGKYMEEEQNIASNMPPHFTYRKYTQDVYPVIIDTLIVEGVEIETGDELGIFTSDGICCGAKRLQDNQPGFILTCWNDDIATELKDGFEWDEAMIFKFYDASLDTEYVIEESVFSTVSSADPQATPVVSAYYGGFGTGQYGIRSLVFDGPGYATPNNYALHQNYPNPFNPSTVIRYDLPKASKVKLEVFNILGQRIAVLIDGIKPAGNKQVIWDANNISSGVYIYRIVAKAVDGTERFASLKKMVLIK